MRRRLVCALALLTCMGDAHAAREPVLKQVDLPHSYYWRELYLPQLTAGPDAVSFLPDGQTLVYSMDGSLWRQRIDGDAATELTHASRAYDNQPDVSRDGRSVVFTRYDGNAIELWRLDLATGREQQLTSGGAVNVEPRLSPDGTRIAWVSTQGTGHFNLFLANMDASGLHHAHPLLGERRSTLDRYYYAAVDHAINPSWSPDGRTIYYIGNPEIAWGTGDLWSVSVDDPSKRTKVLVEETSWSAHPELAPDGKRLLYASYHGRQWQQLWLTTPAGAPPLPLTFGEFDRRNARWSPDGQHLAYVDNEAGTTTLRIMDIPGGATHALAAAQRQYKLPMARLTLDIVDETGARTPARVAIIGNDGRAHAPRDAWVHADDGFDRARQTSETHYFHCAPPCTLDVPAGSTQVWIQHGFAYAPWRQQVNLSKGSEKQLRATLQPQRLPATFGQWISADLHIHMNYGGHYRNTPAHLAQQARAEDLDLAYDLVVNKEERVPDIAAFRTDPDPASTARTLVLHGQEYHTSFWGHLGLLGLNDHYLTPGYTAYRHTAMASPYPTNAAVADLAHAQGALVGYVHPFDTLPDPAHDAVLSNELPADVIEGKVDYIEVLGFSDHKATAQVWYRLLNLGFHLPTGAGTDAMANYAALRGPVGLNRVFLDTGGKRTAADAMAALKAGHGFASNGPLLGLLLDDARPGDTLAPGKHHYRVALRSPVSVDHLELVHNGVVVKSFTLQGDHRQLDASGDITLDGGWLLLRAWNEGADPLVLDLYPYATTNPVWLGDHVRAASAAADAAWFADWVGRNIEAASARDDYNTEQEKRMTLDYLKHAHDAYRALAGGAQAHP
ncbi:CehA/McbA family metallohydrolase [Dyella sp.]|uniref:CehA/McbA family metallohydrolase n=1 Tax=Dyella sp. TaxID=1869338 RepID=UPI002D78AC28|nr:CehA/McbA family metallohydrolase [Dyella sp.]